MGEGDAGGGGVKPTLHVTNWSSRKLHGPGRKWTIMSAPRKWEHGDGRVLAFVPQLMAMRAVRAGRLSLEHYKLGYLGGVELRDLSLGFLQARVNGTSVSDTVADGDTLCCACSRDKAAAGECHRVWAAEALVAAGWRVVLDGRELEA